MVDVVAAFEHIAPAVEAFLQDSGISADLGAAVQKLIADIADQAKAKAQAIAEEAEAKVPASVQPLIQLGLQAADAEIAKVQADAQAKIEALTAAKAAANPQ